MKTGKVDWEEARRRIAAIEKLFARILSPPPQEITRILKKRAEFLALEIEREREEEKIEVLEFKLGEARYAVQSNHVRSVHHIEQLTSIPCTPDFVLGIANIRGEILSVVDILKFFGLPGMGHGEMMVLLEKRDMRFCIVADAISGVHEIAREAMNPAPSSLSGAQYFLGMAPGHLIMLDAVKLLTDERLVVEEEV